MEGEEEEEKKTKKYLHTLVFIISSPLHTTYSNLTRATAIILFFLYILRKPFDLLLSPKRLRFFFL